MMVKICGITNREDAETAIEAGATALGFNFYAKSPRYVEPALAAEIGAHFDALKVGIFVDAAPDSVVDVMRAARVDVAQVYGERRYPGVRIWRALPVGGEISLPRDEDAEAFLLDGFSSAQRGGTGETFDWALARGLQARVVIAGGLDESNVAGAIEQARPWGVDACSRIERAPGKKDHGKMRRFIAAALASSAALTSHA